MAYYDLSKYPRHSIRKLPTLAKRQGTFKQVTNINQLKGRFIEFFQIKKGMIIYIDFYPSKEIIDYLGANFNKKDYDKRLRQRIEENNVFVRNIEI